MRSILKTVNETTLRHYTKEYEDGHDGSRSQRKYPNEELSRFLGRNFGDLSQEHKSSLSILETGCGSGGNLWMIAKEGFRASGLDISSAALELAEQRLAEYGCTAELFKASMTQIPCPDSSFDVVVDVFSSNCLDTSDGKRFLEEVSRILKPSGLFFSYFPSKSSDSWTLEQKADRCDQNTLHGFKRKKSPYFGNNYAFRFHSREEYQRLIQNVGLEIVWFETLGRTYGSGNEYFEFLVVEARLTS